MASVAVYRTSAFTDGKTGGNEAGVVLQAGDLDSHSMQDVASAIGYSETAFVKSVKDAVITVRYFTPKTEVPLCGHATIALLNLLRHTETLQVGGYTLQTPAGTFKVKISQNDATLVFCEPRIIQTYDTKRFIESLSINHNTLNAHPAAIIDAGVKELFLGFKEAYHLENYIPDKEAIKAVSEALGVAGVVLYTTSTPDALAVVRNFLPAIGIEEESATGTAAASLATFLHTHHAPVNDGTIRQGEALGKPSLIHVSMKENTIEISGKFRVIDTVDVTL